MSTNDTPTPSEREAIKAYFIAERGYWRPWTETLLHVAPGFVQQYARYAGHPAREGPLSPRMVELIYVGLDASSSHLFQSGLQTHLQRALDVGATQADIVDVLHLVAVQGLASVCQASDILLEMTGTGAASDSVNPTLQDRMARLGPTHGLALNALAQLAPAFTDVVLDFIELGGTGGGLAPVERTLVQLAMHACFTAFNATSVRQLISTGLAQGATVTEMHQAIQLGAHLAVHGTALGANVLGALTAQPAP